MESTETPKPKKIGKVAEPLALKDYQAVKNRYPNLDWNDEDQSYTTKKGTKSYAKKLFYFKPLALDQIAMGRMVKAERQKNQWDKFLQHLRNGSRVSKAAETAGLSVASVKNRFRQDPEFRERWIEAEAIAAEPIEDALYDAGLNGNVPAATRWLEERSTERWPKPKQVLETKNVYELDVSDRMANILRLQAQLQQRLELEGGPKVIDAEAIEPEE